MTEPKYPWYRGPRGRDVHPPPPEPERERNAALYDAKRGIDRTGPTVESQRAHLDRPFAAKRVEPASAVSKAETDSPYIDAEVRRLQPKPYKVEMHGQLAVPGRVDPRTGQRVVSPSGVREFDLHGKEKPLLPFIGEELNSEACKKISRPYRAADVHFSGPSVESTRAMLDKPVTSQPVVRQPQRQPEVAVTKESPRPARGEAAIWTPRGRVVVGQGAPSPGTDRTDIVEPPANPPLNLDAPSEAEAVPKYQPGVKVESNPNKSYVYAWHEYGNPPRKAPERGRSQATEEKPGENETPVDDSGGSGGA